MTAARAQLRTKDAAAQREQEYLRRTFALMVSVQKLETDRLRDALHKRVAAEHRGWSLVEELLSLFSTERLRAHGAAWMQRCDKLSSANAESVDD